MLNQTGKIRYSTSEPESPSVNVDKVVILLSSYVMQEGIWSGKLTQGKVVEEAVKESDVEAETEAPPNFHFNIIIMSKKDLTKVY